MTRYYDDLDTQPRSAEIAGRHCLLTERANKDSLELCATEDATSSLIDSRSELFRGYPNTNDNLPNLLVGRSVSVTRSADRTELCKMAHPYPSEKKLLEELLIMYKETTVCLWNPSHPGYTNKVSRRRAMETLLVKFRELDPSADTYKMKKKIENMRTTYKRERLKVIHTYRSHEYYIVYVNAKGLAKLGTLSCQFVRPQIK